MDRFVQAAARARRWRRGAPVAPPMGRALGVLYVVGACTALLWVVVPHDADRGDGVVAGMAGLAVVLGLVLLTTGRRIPTVLLHAALAAIQVVIAVAYVAGADPSGDIRLFFLWATPYAALYWGLRAAVGHLAWTATVVVTCLALLPASTHRVGVGVGLVLLATLVATSVLVMTAATALHAAEAAQRHDATHDALTGLGNRRRLLEALPSAGQRSAALVLLDLDDFKAVNDRFGHAAGDELLRDVGRRLSQVVRAGDLACRLGGDEFALLVHDLDGPVEAGALAERAVRAAAAARTAGARALTVGASAGVRLLDAGVDVGAALHDADVALYAAKASTAGRSRVWTPGLFREADEHLEMAADLRADLRADCGADAARDLRHGQLRLVYQPVVELASLRVVGLEALVRWRHPVRGDVPPDRFVRCAERAGLVDELTRWVLHRALTTAAAWPTGGQQPPCTLGVNISALQLSDLQIVADVREALARSAVLPEDVVLEVTETAAVGDLASAGRTLSALKRLGVRLALDDFGTGYSSLSYVQALPFDVLKVDRAFVRAAAEDDRRAVATVAAVGALAARLDVLVVAEGVEDRAELPALQALGCGYAQGFGLVRPMEADALARRLAAAVETGWVLSETELLAPGAAPSEPVASL